MKKILMAVGVLLVALSCLPHKKDEDPKPDLAGTYQISRYEYHGATIIPQTGVSGQVKVMKDTDTQISVAITVSNASTGKTVNSGTVAVPIRQSSGSGYELVDNGTSVGSIDGTTFSLSEADNTGSYSITARK